MLFLSFSPPFPTNLKTREKVVEVLMHWYQGFHLGPGIRDFRQATLSMTLGCFHRSLKKNSTKRTS